MRKYIFLFIALILCLGANAQRSVEPYGRSHVMVYDDAYCRNSVKVDEPTPCRECGDEVVETIREKIIPVEDIERITYVHYTKTEVRHVYADGECRSNRSQYEPTYQYEQSMTPPIWNINFNINSAEFSNGAMTNLINVAKYCMSNNNICLHVLGYADRMTGTNEYNYSLSKIRADKVVNELVSMGVNRNLIYITYNGDRVQPYPFENDWNRCVRIKVLK